MGSNSFYTITKDQCVTNIYSIALASAYQLYTMLYLYCALDTGNDLYVLLLFYVVPQQN